MSFESKRTEGGQEKTREQDKEKNFQMAFAESGSVVIDPGQKDLPTSINLFRFQEVSEPALQKMQTVAQRFARYLARPIIVDNFEGTLPREEWRARMKQAYDPEVVTFFESNRLRINALQELLFPIPGLHAALMREPQTEAVQKVIELLDACIALTEPSQSFAPEYKAASLDKKLQITAELSSIGREYISSVTEHTQQTLAA